MGKRGRTCLMKRIHMGNATAAADSLSPRGRGVSKPTHTPATRSGENPMNQASVFSFVVPVLPAR